MIAHEEAIGGRLPDETPLQMQHAGDALTDAVQPRGALEAIGKPSLGNQECRKPGQTGGERDCKPQETCGTSNPAGESIPHDDAQVPIWERTEVGRDCRSTSVRKSMVLNLRSSAGGPQIFPPMDR